MGLVGFGWLEPWLGKRAKWGEALAVTGFSWKFAKYRNWPCEHPTLNHHNFVPFLNLQKFTTTIVLRLYWTILVPKIM